MSCKSKEQLVMHRINKMRESTLDAAKALRDFADFHAELSYKVAAVNNMLNESFPDRLMFPNELFKRAKEFSSSIADFAGLSDTVIDEKADFYDEESAIKSILYYLQKEVDRIESRGDQMSEAYFGQEFGNEGIVISGNVAKFILQKLSQ